MKHIKVLGTGCSRCQTTAEMIQNVADELNITIELEKVEDMARIAAAGVMSTPGVLVDDKLVHAGGLPSRAQVQAWLQEQTEES
ncbi:MAG: thioredoxin family protein [Gammaproteobacteria bacterium]|nr:MAG: thioredoxin family protein [Gammaproteobacteria bacterium]